MLRGGLRRNRLLGGQMFDRNPLAVDVAVMTRMRDPTMQGVVAHNFLRTGTMARGGLILRRCDGSRDGRILGEGCRAQAESGDGGNRQYELVHDVLLG